MTSRLWLFLADRAAEMRGTSGAERSPDADSIMAVLAEHNGAEAREGAPVCAACYTPCRLDDCPTLRALAWRWQEHSAWLREWALTPQVYLTTWPASENCFCGKAAGAAHRRGAPLSGCRFDQARRGMFARSG